jgi:hypothetical protein
MQAVQDRYRELLALEIPLMKVRDSFAILVELEADPEKRRKDRELVERGLAAVMHREAELHRALDRAVRSLERMPTSRRRIVVTPEIVRRTPRQSHRQTPRPTAAKAAADPDGPEPPGAPPSSKGDAS